MAGWNDRWQKGTKLGSGGNGSTYRATRIDGSDTTVYAIKLLHEKWLRDKPKRAQMAREIAKLRKLPPEWDGVPRIVDASSEDEDPFVVMELVDGVTLEKLCANVPLLLEPALDLTLSLLTTVERCHGLGITHRDIKDDNVILRGGEPARPVLLDFGLSVEVDDASMTSAEHQVGNRFLGLPEHQTPHSNKRDSRSDLAQCCGVLFYALTCERPMTLVDEHGKQPHHREEAQKFLGAIEPNVLVRLAHVFDIGFRNKIDERWQDAARLREALLRVRSPVESAVPAPLPTVESLWTLHIRDGKPTGLYFNHRLKEGDSLQRFFGSPGKETSFDGLGRDIQEAALSLWSELTVRPELRGAVRNRHALDHLCHNWSDIGKLKWNQEIKYPETVEGTAPLDIAVESLSAPGRAAVLVLDQAARHAGREAVESAQLQQAEWQKQA